MFVPSAWSKTLLAGGKLFVKLKIFECQKAKFIFILNKGQ